jgi:hypothetical protein
MISTIYPPHPYILPRLVLCDSPSVPHEISWDDFLAEPQDVGQWTRACLLRVFVMSSCPRGGNPDIQSTEYRTDAIRVSWAVEPSHRQQLIQYPEGIGNPQPTYVVVSDLPPTDTFQFIRALGQDEIEGYFWTSPNADRFKEALSLLPPNTPILAASQNTKTWLSQHNLSEATLPIKPLIARVLREFRCPDILKPLFGE